jgi:Asp-tRNA(Asn)/Glu-tRNA(Gln) amidotransferase A subunit family amidase
MVPFALGEQTAGSNLRPAAFCGVAGLKPTFGRIGRDGCFQFSYSHDHVGLIGLTMADLALALSVLAGPDPRDRTARAAPAPPPTLDSAGIRPPRIGLVRNFFPERTGPVMQQAVETSAERLRAAGAPVVDLRLPDDFGLVWLVHRLVGGAESAAFRARRLAEGSATRTARDLANSLIPGAYYLHAQRLRHHLWQRVQEHCANVDLLLMAVAPAPAPKGTGSTGDALLLVPWSCLGYPAITLNGGLSPEGLPLGLQLVGAPMSEPGLLAFGAWCEQVLGRLPAPVISP